MNVYVCLYLAEYRCDPVLYFLPPLPRREEGSTYVIPCQKGGGDYGQAVFMSRNRFHLGLVCTN